MSHISQFGNGRWIIAGEQIVDTISTLQFSGNAARMIEAITCNSTGARISRSFGEWQKDGPVKTCQGQATFRERSFPITAKIGAEDERGLILRDVSGKTYSVKALKGTQVLEIGSALEPDQLLSRANELVGCWIVHGRNWTDRSGFRFHRPWGQEMKGSLESSYLEIVDGATFQPRPTLAKLIELGCRRSTHVGEWFGRHSTIIPFAAGMDGSIHEFKKEGGRDICYFKRLQIGQGMDIWGGYSTWNERIRQSGSLGIWQDLALRCASPFNFHVHATRTIFPTIQLDSDFLLEKLGQDRLRGLLEIIAAEQPERFYRLIDPMGRTFRLRGVDKDVLLFGDDLILARSELANNAIQTFQELQLVQQDCAHALERKFRVVLDSHAYLVIEALARRARVVHELSGRDMHRYLTDGSDALMHRARNERLFLLLRSFFGIESLRFYIHPPLSWNSGLDSQYDANLQFWKKEEFLNREV